MNEYFNGENKDFFAKNVTLEEFLLQKMFL